jgi:hypothetical protein
VNNPDLANLKFLNALDVAFAYEAGRIADLVDCRVW